jgi:hypothetical protein
MAVFMLVAAAGVGLLTGTPKIVLMVVGFGAAVDWIANFALIEVFPGWHTAVGLGWVMVAFAVIAILAIGFVARWLPETGLWWLLAVGSRRGYRPNSATRCVQKAGKSSGLRGRRHSQTLPSTNRMILLGSRFRSQARRRRVRTRRQQERRAPRAVPAG